MWEVKDRAEIHRLRRPEGTSISTEVSAGAGGDSFDAGTARIGAVPTRGVRRPYWLAGPASGLFWSVELEAV